MQYLEGILKITNLVLSFIAGLIAISLIKVSHKTKNLKPWVMLLIALIFFGVQEILGALRAFKIWETAYLTHLIPTIILAFIITALIKQIMLHKTK